MNYHKIDPCSISNGIRVRTVLWVSGCSHNCFNCQNPETHDINSGKPFDDKAQTELFDCLSKPYIDGITLSGGDPLMYENLPDVYDIVTNIKNQFPDKTIWLYTGFTLSCGVDSNGSLVGDFADADTGWDNGLLRNQIIRKCDVIVDGEYKDELRDITLQFRGSSNQRLIDVKKTINAGRIVLWGDASE